MSSEDEKFSKQIANLHFSGTKETEIQVLTPINGAQLPL